MRVVFIGNFTPNDRFEEFRAISRYFDVPGGVLQNALVNGFDALTNLQIITSPNLKGIKGRKIESFSFSHNGTTKDYCVGYKDIFLLRELLVAKEMLYDLKKCGQIDTIFIYSTGISQLFAARRYKRMHPSVRIIEMVADLPEFMRSNASIVYKFAKKIQTAISYHFLKCVDCFALLSLAMAERMPISGKTIIQIEGVYHQNGNNHSVQCPKRKIVVYSGDLGERYGVLDMLEAFSRTTLDFQMLVCGFGVSDKVLEYASKDKRIVYLGSLPRESVLRLQREATLLINPRHKKDKYTKYSFPSKTMEYMASGTPTLMSELECLPEEYKQHLYFFDDESIEGMAKRIEEVCSKPQEELDAFGRAASEFIVKNKNAEAQVKKILGALE